MKYNNTLYYYVLNAQGDVVRIVNSSRSVVASYTYDPWGKIISSSGALADVNPLRYRGYYYDSETGFYYLQSLLQVRKRHFSLITVHNRYLKEYFRFLSFFICRISFYCRRM